MECGGGRSRTCYSVGVGGPTSVGVARPALGPIWSDVG